MKRGLIIWALVIIALLALHPLYWIVFNPLLSNVFINPEHNFVFVETQYEARNYYIENGAIQLIPEHRKYLDGVEFKIELLKTVYKTKPLRPCEIRGGSESIGIFSSYEEVNQYLGGQEVFSESEYESGIFSQCIEGEVYSILVEDVGDLSTKQLDFFLYDVKSEEYKSISFEEVKSLNLAPRGDLYDGGVLDPSDLKIDHENLECQDTAPLVNWYCWIPGYNDHIDGSYFQEGRFKKKIKIDNFFYNRIVAWVK